MEPKGSIFEGKTLDDAVRKGLDALGLSRAEVMINVIDEGSNGFLGIGARPYRVRVMPRPGGAIREPERERGDRGGRGRRTGRGEGRNGEARVQERGGRHGAGRGRSEGRDRPAEGAGRRSERGGERRPERGGERRIEPRGDRERRDERRPEPADRGNERGRESRTERAPMEAQERAPRADAGEAGREPRDAERDAGRRRRRGRRGRGGRTQGEGSRAPVAEAAPMSGEPDNGFEPAPAAEPTERAERSNRRERAPMRSESNTAIDNEPAMPNEELATLAQTTTTDLLKAMGFEGTITAKAEGTSVEVTAEVADDEELLTGRKGETRQALQHLLTRMINRGEGSRYHLQLEINDFWAHRERELEDLAKGLADQALADQGEAVSEYLNSQERRIIHVTLRDDSRVKTYALGTGLIKRVAVAPADFASGDRADD
jgi:spoIIIJ-associated protein